MAEQIPEEIMREAERLAYNCHPTEIARALMARDKRAADALDAEANRIDGLAWADRFGLRLAARFLRTYKGSPAKEERS